MRLVNQFSNLQCRFGNEEKAKVPAVRDSAVAVVEQNVVSKLPGHHSCFSEWKERNNGT